MFKVIIFCIVCVKYNDAFVDIADDLDYAGASGTFIPLNKNTDTYDMLSVRQIKPYLLASTNSIKDLIKNLKKKVENENNFISQFDFASNCNVKVFNLMKWLTLKVENECESLNIYVFIQKYFPNLKMIDSLSLGFIKSKILPINEIKVLGDKVKISANFDGTFFASVLCININSIKLELFIPLSSATEKFNFQIYFKLANTPVIIKFNLAENHIAALSMKVNEINIGKLIEFFNKHPFPINYGNLDFAFDNLEKANIDGEIKGLYNTSNNQLQLYAKVNYNYQDVAININFIIDNNNGTKKLAFVAELSSFDKIFNDLVKKIEFKVPKLLKNLVKNCTLTVCSKMENGSLDLLDKDFVTINGNSLTAIETGINVYVATNMKNNLNQCGSENLDTKDGLNTESNLQIQEQFYFNKSNIVKKNKQLSRRNTDYIQDSVKRVTKNSKDHKAVKSKKPPIDKTPTQSDSQNDNNQKAEEYPDLVKINLALTHIVIKLPKGFSENLIQLFKCFYKEINNYIPKNEWSDIIPDFFKERMSKFDISELSFSTEEFKITIEYLEPIKTDAPFYLEFQNSKLEIIIKKGISFIFKGQAEVNHESFNGKSGSVTLNFEKSSISVDINFPDLVIDSLLKSFKDDASNIYLEKFKTWFTAIHTPLIHGKLNLKKKEGELIVSAVPVIYGMNHLAATVFVWKLNRNSVEFALGLKAGSAKLSDVLTKFVETNLPWLANAEIVMVFSTADTENKPTEIKTLSKTSENTSGLNVANELRNKMEKGFVLEATLPINKNVCEENQICLILFDGKVEQILLKGKIGGDTLTLNASIEKKISIFDGFILKSVHLVLTFGKEVSASIKFVTEWKVEEPNGFEIKLKGSISYGTSGLEVSACMDGMVFHPFGYTRLAFGYLYVSFAYKKIAQISFGGKVWLGNVQKGVVENKNHLLEFKADIGIMFKYPYILYIMGNYSGPDLNIQNALKALDYEPKLPEWLAETGFVGDIKLSFSIKEVSLKELGITINPGLYLKSHTNIFGYEARCEIKLSINPLIILFSAWFDPISLWAFDMYRSKNNHKEGPVFFISSSDEDKVNIKAYFNMPLIGLQSDVDIKVNDNYLFVHFDTKAIFGLVYYDVTIKYHFQYSIMDYFYVDGCFESTLLNHVVNTVEKKFNQSLTIANSIMNTSKSVFEFLITKLDAIDSFLQLLREDLEIERDDLKEEEDRTNALQEKNYKDYQGCLNKCDKDFLGSEGILELNCNIFTFLFGCLQVNNEAVNRQKCFGKCTLNHVKNKFITFTDRTKTQLQNVYSSTLTIIIDQITSFLDVLQNVLDSCNYWITWVKGVLLPTVKKITGYLSMYKIKSICIKAELGNTTYFRGYVHLLNTSTTNEEIKENNFGSQYFGSALINKVLENIEYNVDPTISELERKQREITSNSSLAIRDEDKLLKWYNGIIKNAEEIPFISELIKDLIKTTKSSTVKSILPMKYLKIKDVAQFENNLFSSQLFPSKEYPDYCRQFRSVVSRYSVIANKLSSALGKNNNIKSRKNNALKNHEEIKRDNFNYIRQAFKKTVVNNEGMELPEYIEYLHILAEQSYQKSNIGKKPYRKNLHHVKEILSSLAVDEEKPVIELAKNLRKAKHMLSEIKRANASCAA